MSRVLVIDPDEERKATVNDLLAEHGFQTVTVLDGAEAVREIRRQAPDVILIDEEVQMGGVETAQVFRRHPHYGSIPILLGAKMGSPAEMQKTARAASKAGISAVLARPYEPRRLLEKLRGCVAGAEKIAAAKKAAETPAAAKEAPVDPERRRQNRAFEVRMKIRELTDLPTLSAAQQRLIEIMSVDDDEIDVNALVKAIQSDQALTIRTMKVAQSAYYGFTGDFVKTAITFLGMSTMRQIVQSATVLEVFDQERQDVRGGLDRRGFWAHSLACGLTMQRLSRDSKASRHFTAGLLHDVGKLILDYRFPKLSRTIVATAREQNRSMQEIETELIGLTHAEIGEELCRLWQLPAEIGESIAHHHRPVNAYRHKYLSSLLYLSNAAVRMMEIGDGGDPTPPVLEDPYAEKLGISLEPVLSQRDDIKLEVEAIIGTEA